MTSSTKPKRKTRKHVMHTPKAYKTDWIDPTNDLTLNRVFRIFNSNNSRQATEISMLDHIPNEIPKANVTKVYVLKKKQWMHMGYKCVDCGKTMTEEIVKDKHPLVCSKELLINREVIKQEEEEFMPVQRIEKNGETYYRWGMHGKLYKTREEAEQQAKAIYASGYKEPTNKSTSSDSKGN